MTNITKAAQDALAALDEIHAGKRHPQLALAVTQQLRAALQDKAVEVREPTLWISQKDLDRLKVTTVFRPLVSTFKPLNDGEIPLFAAQPAPVVPEKRTVDPRGIVETADSGYVDGWNACIDAILALRPAVEPMTDDGVDAKCLTIIGHLLSRRERDRIVWRMAEAHHGITAKAEVGA